MALRIGDKVQVTKKGLATTGNVGVVTYICYNGASLCVHFKGSLSLWYSTTSVSLYKEPVKEQEKKPSLGFYILNITTSYTTGKVHATKEEAEDWAKKMASSSKTTNCYCVVEIISEFQAEVTVKQTK